MIEGYNGIIISMLTGRLIQKAAPLPSGLFSADIFPPWASTKLLEINNPKLTPPASDFVTNFSK